MIIKDLERDTGTERRMYDNQYSKDPSDYHVKERMYKGLLFFLGSNRSSPQEKTRLHPTPTGPGRCPAAPIYNISFAITYYGVDLPVITCSQHTQYFL